MRKTWDKIKLSRNWVLSVFLLFAIAFSIITTVRASAPNPGHTWSEVGDVLVNLTSQITGILGSSNGGTGNGFTKFSGPTTVEKTFTLPNANATICTTDSVCSGYQPSGSYLTNPMTTLGDVIYGGASGVTTRLGGSAGFLKSTGAAAPAWSSIDLAADVGTSILPTANGGTGIAYFTAAGPTIARTYTFPDANATVLTSNAAVSVAQGGTGLSTLTANNVILGNGANEPTFVAPGTSGNVLTSNGTTWTSAAPSGGGSTMTTVVTRPVMATGAIAAVALNSLTAYKVALFTIPYSITVNQLTYNVGAVTTAGSYRICVYSETGATKHIDVTDVPTAGVNDVAVGSVALSPGNYYIAMGCATTCNNTITMFTTTAATWINTTAAPAGKKDYEGTVTMTSGTCNATIDTTAISGAISSAPVMRLDN